MSEDPAEGRPARVADAGARPDEEGADEASHSSPSPSPELRIDAPAAGSLVGDPVATGHPATEPPAAQAEPAPPVTESFELPNWADPPTGQVPRVLLERSEAEGIDSEALRGPTWRQESEGFEEAEDLSFLLPEEETDHSIAGREVRVERPFGFSELDTQESLAARPSEGSDDDESAWTSLFEEQEAASPGGSPARRRHSARHQRRTPSPRALARAATKRRSPLTATLTGLALAAIAVVCFLIGSITTEALVVAATTIAAGELFAVLQGVGYRPATLVGLLGVPALALAAYLHGAAGVVVVAGVVFVLLGAWFLSAKSGDEPVVNLAVSLLVTSWVGISGAFAGLLLAPSLHPHRHGIALLVGVIALVAADDIGAYAIGARVGRHRLAPSISPGKTVEGLVGGTVLCLLVAGLALPHLHPLHLSSAIALGVIVAVLAPIGDLLESRVKRDLGVKDMGSVLPSHGGIFDRIDATLFVLPAAYILFIASHLR